MLRDFQQIEWDDALDDDCRQIVRLAVREDLEREQDWTTLALVPEERRGAADVVARQSGIVAGMQAAAVAIDEMGGGISIEHAVPDGQSIAAGTRLARLRGSVRDLLTCERIVLNLLGRLTGVATRTRAFVDKVDGTGAQIYDTRKTTPAWRRLEKFAVRCGGGRNHRTGLYDAILIKDNHLAQFTRPGQAPGQAAAAAVRHARQFLSQLAEAGHAPADMILEVEVDSLEQLAAVLQERPDIVLLDNMPVSLLCEAVSLRGRHAPGVELEASGGVNLETVRQIAQTGVERISVGSLTHAATSLDIGLDWAVGED